MQSIHFVSRTNVENLRAKRLDDAAVLYMHIDHRFIMEAVAPDRTRLSETESRREPRS